VHGRAWKAETRGLEVIGDSRAEEGGENLGMTPGELLVSAIGLCTGIDLSFYHERHPNLDLSQVRFALTWQMAAERPPRIAAIQMHVIIPAGLSDAERAAVTRIVNSCLVHNTLERGAEITVTLEEA